MRATAVNPLFAVIIPVLNNWDLTRDCLCSLREHTPGDGFEVVVVDNGSVDAGRTDLEPLGNSLFPGRFTGVRFEENRNFGPACNAGAHIATAPLLFFLNNDTLLTSEWAGPLLDALGADDSLGAVGPLLLYPDNTVQHLGVAVTPSGIDHLYKGIPSGHPVIGNTRTLQCLTGAAFFTRRELFWESGGFYEGYRNGCEDLELSVRIRERGKALRCIPTSRVYHLESKTPGRMDKEKDNFRLLFERCGDLLAVDIHRHARNDGFEPRLNGWDDIDVVTTQVMSELLFASLPPDNPEMTAALLGQNPFWLQGAERLCAMFERAGDVAAAFGAAWRVMEIHPTPAAGKKALALAAKAGNSSAVEGCEQALRALLARHADTARRISRLERIIERARLHNDAELEHLYLQRLREVAPGTN